MEEIVYDIVARIEEEEKAIKSGDDKKLQTEKMKAEANDKKEKFSKEKKIMEKKLSDATATLAEEEEKAKHLLKLKVKHENTIKELEDKCTKDNQQKQVVEQKQQIKEKQQIKKKQQIKEKQLFLRKREEDVAQTLMEDLDVEKEARKADPAEKAYHATKMEVEVDAAEPDLGEDSTEDAEVPAYLVTKMEVEVDAVKPDLGEDSTDEAATEVIDFKKNSNEEEGRLLKREGEGLENKGE